LLIHRENPMIISSEEENPYSITPEDLEEIINLSKSKISPSKIETEWMGMKGISQRIKSDLKKGLPLEEEVRGYSARKTFLGENVYPQSPPKWWVTFFFEALGDQLLIILMIVAIISIVLETAFPNTPADRPYGWISGFAILVAVFIVSMVSSINNWNKERQFRALNAASKIQDVQVIRNSKPRMIKTNQVLVGDLIILEQGSAIPADGILVESFDLKIDESTMTGESMPVSKKADCFGYMLSGCCVAEGSGKMMVLCVGPHSEWGKTLAQLQQRGDNETPLQKKLSSLADVIGKFGILFALATFLISIVGWLITKMVFASQHPTEQVFHATDANIIVQYIVTAITIVVVAVPEGLPLAVTISLAFSVRKMMQENNLVRHLDACETMGGATTICSDKTGTLTENQMTVIAGYIGEDYYPSFKPLPAEDTTSLSQDLKNLIIIGASCNSTANLGKQELKVGDPRLKDPNYKPKDVLLGNKTEGALLKFVNNHWKGNYLTIREKYPVKARVSFNSQRKSMSTIVLDPLTNDYMLHIKGASENICKLCTKIYKSDGNVGTLEEEKQKEMLDKITEIAKRGIRTICLAYKNLGHTIPEDLPAEEHDLIFLCIMGIEDPLRAEVKAAVLKCQNAGILVRMVTGDNIETAKKIAEECGIYNPGIPTSSIESDKNSSVIQVQNANGVPVGIAEIGPNFRNWTPEQFARDLKHLQVLARSSPQDKYILVENLIKQGEVVAVTGDGTNDAPALKRADVGLAMGDGTQVAKEAADIIITDNNFATIVTACKWGRNIYESIRKFLQFQLTVNVVACLLLVVTSITQFIVPSSTGGGASAELPLTAIQMLWLNLIMDTFAALALATEPPFDGLLDRQPYGRFESLLTSQMIWAIACQAIYQLTTLFVFYYIGVSIGVSTPGYFEGQLVYTAQQTNNTFVFNIFVMCQIFNLFNARKIYKWEWNICKQIWRSYMFLVIFGFITVVQIGFVEFGNIPILGKFLTTTGLNWMQWLISVGIGFGCIPYHYLVVRSIGNFLPDMPAGKNPADVHSSEAEEGEAEESVSLLAHNTSPNNPHQNSINNADEDNKQ